MKLTIEIPGQVSTGEGWSHGVVTLSLDTANNTLSLSHDVEIREYGYTTKETQTFAYRLVPVTIEK